MSGNTTTSNNFTGLYGASGGTTVPTTPYGNANVVSLLAVGSDGANTVGNISATGNVSANYFIGNGSQLTGIVTSSYGNAQVASFLSAFGSNTISTTGNITSGNLQTGGAVSATGNVTGAYIFGNGSQLTGLPATYSNANVTTLLANFGSNSISTTGNITAGNFAGNGSQLSALAGANVTGTVANATFATTAGTATSATTANTANSVAGANVTGTVANATFATSAASATTAGTVTTNAQPNITSVGILSTLSTTGNITGGNLLTPGVISATGNITTAGYFVGTFAGNISGNLTVPGANTQVIYNNSGNAGASAGFTFDQASNVVTVSGNIVGGNVSTAGNVTGSYILGNGSQLTGLPAGYSNANVTTLLAAFGSNTISTTGNITAGYVIGDGSLLTNLTGANVTGTVANATYALNANAATSANVVTDAAQPNITSVGTLVNLSTSGNISAVGNITGNVFSGNGAGLTNINAGNIVGAYGNANVANFLGNYGSNTISTTGNVTTGNLNVQLDAVITGNLTVNGNTTLVNSNVVTINDKFINVANNAATSAQANGGGLGVGPVGAEYATLTYNSTNNDWNTNIPLSVTGNVSGGNIIGNGQYLSSITGANVTGTVANAAYATNAGTASTVSGNAQANITSVGTLTSLSVSGNINGSNVNASTVQATTSAGLALKNSAGTTQASMGAGGGDNFAISVSTNINGANAQIDISPTGNSGHVHIKPTGLNSVEIAPTYPGSINNMVIGNITPAAVSATTVSASGNITANYFLGNGSQLTGVLTNLQGTMTGNITGANTYGITDLKTLQVSALGNILIGNAIIGQLSASPATINMVADEVSTNLLFTAGGNITAPNVVATANAFATYFIGNGSQLTGIVTSGNSTSIENGTSNVKIATANGNTTVNIGGTSNVTVFASTGQFTTGVISASGNITTAGAVSAAGNITTPGWIFGGQAGNGGGSFNGPVYSTLFSATGNVTGDYFIGNGSLLTGISTSSSNISNGTSNINIATSNGNATVNIGGTANVTVFATTGAYVTGVVSASGNVTGSNITTPGFVSAAGNIAATGWVFGNTGGAFNGPVNSTSVSATGNITGGNLLTTGLASVTGNLIAGNIITSGSTINNTNAFAFSPANTLQALNTGRIVIGNAWDGNAAVQYDPLNVTRGSRLAVMDKGVYNYTANSLQSGTRLLTSYFWLDLDGTTVGTSASSRNSAGAFVTNVGNGSSAQTGLGFYGVQSAIALGNASGSAFGNVGNIGNVTLNIGVGQGSFVQVYNGSTANNAIGTYSSLLIASAGGVMANSIGYAYSRADAANNLSTFNIGYFHPDNVSTFGSSMSGNARLATNYYAFYNKDNYADTQLGSLRSFHYFTSNVLATGGSQAISKANGQYQTTTGNLTANLDVTSFTNFATSNTVTSGTNTGTKLSSDVVTLLVPMGATPYSINMPTGNTQIKYVGNISTVTGPANSITQVQITGSNVGGTVQYLVNMENSGSNILTDGLISATGNITGGNLLTGGLISSTGTVTGSSLIGTVITATGNITGGNVISQGRAQAVNYSETVASFGNATGTITPNISLGAIQSMTLTGNITLNSITNIAAGQSMTLLLTQDGTGGRTLTSTMLFAGNSRTLSATAGATDIVSLFYSGSNYYASLTTGYA
jgi:filamentous hemagglutinin